MAYRANIDITVGEKKYHPGDVIDKISAADARWLLREGYISEQAAEKPVKKSEKPAESTDKKQSRRKPETEKPEGK